MTVNYQLFFFGECLVVLYCLVLISWRILNKGLYSLYIKNIPITDLIFFSRNIKITPFDPSAISCARLVIKWIKNEIGLLIKLFLFFLALILL